MLRQPKGKDISATRPEDDVILSLGCVNEWNWLKIDPSRCNRKGFPHLRNEYSSFTREEKNQFLWPDAMIRFVTSFCTKQIFFSGVTKMDAASKLDFQSRRRIMQRSIQAFQVRIILTVPQRFRKRRLKSEGRVYFLMIVHIYEKKMLCNLNYRRFCF